MKSILEQLKSKDLFRNAFLYLIFGGVAFIFDYLIFLLLYFQIDFEKYIANIISMHVGMLVSFSLNAFINFKKTNRIGIRFIKYYAIILCGIGLSSLILWVGGFFIERVEIIKLIALIVVSGLQFILNRFYTFR